MQIWTFLLAIGVPSAVVGLMFRRIERRMDEERKARKAQDEARLKFEEFQTRGMTATMALCEANSIALQNGRCNGETHKALEYMKKVKGEQRDFLVSKGIEHIFD